MNKQHTLCGVWWNLWFLPSGPSHYVSNILTLYRHLSITPAVCLRLSPATSSHLFIFWVVFNAFPVLTCKLQLCSNWSDFRGTFSPPTAVAHIQIHTGIKAQLKTKLQVSDVHTQVSLALSAAYSKILEIISNKCLSMYLPVNTHRWRLTVWTGSE